MYKTTVKIDGMMCGMCEVHINDSIRKKLKSRRSFLLTRKVKP